MGRTNSFKLKHKHNEHEKGHPQCQLNRTSLQFFESRFIFELRHPQPKLRHPPPPKKIAWLPSENVNYFDNLVHGIIDRKHLLKLQL